MRFAALDRFPDARVVITKPNADAEGHAIATLLEEWATGDDSFGKDPPNATVSVFNKDASTVKDVVVVLKNPKLDGDKLTFNVQVLEGDLAGADGPAERIDPSAPPGTDENPGETMLGDVVLCPEVAAEQDKADATSALAQVQSGGYQDAKLVVIASGSKIPEGTIPQ